MGAGGICPKMAGFVQDDLDMLPVLQPLHGEQLIEQPLVFVIPSPGAWQTC